MQNKLVLPRQDKQTGEYYLSYSAIKAWKELKGFSTGRLGKEEYIRSYFFGEEYGDEQGWAQFGSEVEDYICKREGGDNFTEEERKILETIIPLGLFQKELKINFGNFFIKGFLDDCSLDLAKIRDYKTASEKSSQKYYTPEYDQLDIYAMGILQETGSIPEMEVCVIEREGNPFRGGGRSVLKVKERVWYIPRTTTAEKLDQLTSDIIDVANDISIHYKTFLKLNK